MPAFSGFFGYRWKWNLLLPNVSVIICLMCSGKARSIVVIWVGFIKVLCLLLYLHSLLSTYFKKQVLFIQDNTHLIVLALNEGFDKIQFHTGFKLLTTIDIAYFSQTRATSGMFWHAKFNSNHNCPFPLKNRGQNNFHALLCEKMIKNKSEALQVYDMETKNMKMINWNVLHVLFCFLKTAKENDEQFRRWTRHAFLLKKR